MARGNGLYCITSSQRMASGEELADMKLKSTKYLDLHPSNKASGNLLSNRDIRYPGFPTS